MNYRQKRSFALLVFIYQTQSIAIATIDGTLNNTSAVCFFN